FFRRDNRSMDRTYFEMKDGEGSFIIPENAIYAVGYFYTDTRAFHPKGFVCHVVNDAGVPLPHAFGYISDIDEFLKKEKEHHGNNLPLSIYAEYMTKLSSAFEQGRITDADFTHKADSCLTYAQDNFSPEDANDLAAMVSLSAFAGDYEKSETLLYKLLKEFPNDSSMIRAHQDLLSAKLVLGKVGFDDVKAFRDSLFSTVADKYPNSPLALFYVTGGFYAAEEDKHFSDNQILNLTEYGIKNMSYNTNLQDNRGLVLMRQKKYEEYENAALQYLEGARNNMGQHYIPMNWERGEETTNQLNVEVSRGYRMLAEVKDSVGELKQSLLYLDSAIFYFKDEAGDYSYEFLMNQMYKHKTSLLTRLNYPKEALKSYETLYELFRDDKLWTSIEELFEQFPDLGNFETYKTELQAALPNNLGVKPYKAPEFSVTGTDSVVYTLSTMKGSVVVLNFWGIYCGPCIREIPEINALYSEFKERGVVFLNPSLDRPLAIERFADRRDEMFAFPSIPEAKQLFEDYKVYAIPTQFVINQRGEVVYQPTGFNDDSIENLKKAIEKALNENS
ncbi:MAG: TlpA disulfide reductase family protein, partial [Bacteroidota bacterium]